MTRAEIEDLNDLRPYQFDTDMEERWYEIGCIDGLDAADAEPDISELWHSNQEMPQQDIDEYGSGKDCLVEIKNSSLIEIGQVLFDDGIFAISCHLNTYAMDEIKRWAYVEDLLPKGGKP